MTRSGYEIPPRNPRWILGASHNSLHHHHYAVPVPRGAGMSRDLKPERAARIRELVLAGLSVRQICTETGHAKQTVMRHRDQMGVSVVCDCGQSAKHKGWCRARYMRSPERQKIVKNYYTETCVDCGGPRHYAAGMRCKACWDVRAAKARADKAAKTRACPICGTPHLVRIDNAPQKTCGAEWCQRIYTFYYVEGRNRPPSVRDGKNNGLQFEFFLSDYLRRCAREQIFGSQHRRAA